MQVARESRFPQSTLDTAGLMSMDRCPSEPLASIHSRNTKELPRCRTFLLWTDVVLSQKVTKSGDASSAGADLTRSVFTV
jgi:hypothetical protein